MRPALRWTPLCWFTALSLAACGEIADTTHTPRARDQAIQVVQHQAGAPIALEISETGTTRVLAMTPRFPVPGHASDPATAAKDFLVNHHDIFQLDAADAGEFVVTGVDVEPGLDMSHVTLQRVFDGIPVYQGAITVHMDGGNGVFRVLGDEFYRAAIPTNRRMLSPREAAVAAGHGLGLALSPGLVAVDGGSTTFDSPRTLDPVKVEPRIVQVSPGDSRFAYQVLVSWLDDHHEQQYQLALVDAQDGSLLAHHSLVDTFTGRVFASSPGANPTSDTRVVVSFDGFVGSPPASPSGWVDASRMTRGNNALACPVPNGSNTCGTQPVANASNSFDFPFDPNQNASNFQPAAVTHAFFLVNYFHDRTYRLGFTEVSKNFQTNNFGKGGAQNDPVQVDVKDSSGNANFATPPDGSPPRMQLFLSNLNGGPTEHGAFDPTVVWHENTHGLSNRLVGGGATTCLNGLQSGGMGEGWGDFLAGSFLNTPVIGAYLSGNSSKGLRQFPMNNAPWTYADIKNGTLTEIHGIGELWAATLWDARNTVGATTMEQLVVSGMKLTPCHPSMLNARDAIIQTDASLNGGANRCRLWSAFAHRLMGTGALSPNDNSTSAIVTSTAVPADCDGVGGGGNGGSSGGTFSSTDVPVSIPDNDSAGARSVINVPSIGIEIRKLTIDVNITHTFVGDLVIQVIAPSGETVTLSNRQGGSADNFIATGRDITLGFTPYRPAAGQWQLVVRDLAAADVGTINSFTLHFVSDLAAPDFTIAANPTSQTVTAGTSATYTINTTVLAGAPQTISLSLSGLPAGVHGSFSAASVTAGGSSTLTLTSSVTAAAGTTQFTITGTGTAASHTANASVTVATDPPPIVTITAPASGSTVSGVVTVTAGASDADGVARVEFELPDGSFVSDPSPPFTALWDSTTVPDGSGYLIHAIATDSRGAISVATVPVTVSNCINQTFSATDVPVAITANSSVTSSIPVTGSGTVGSLLLSLDITHVQGNNLSVTLISPTSAEFLVFSGLSPASTIIMSPIAIPVDQVAAGEWTLRVESLSSLDTGTLNSWSMTIVGECASTAHWTGTAGPNLPTIDNGTACTSLAVTTTGGDSSLAMLDIFGHHDFRSILTGTLAHNGTTVTAFPMDSFSGGSGTFSFTNRAVPGLSGDSSGTWTLCIVDTNSSGDSGVLTAWSVHD